MSICPTKMLFATDGSENANLALCAAVDIAEKTGSELHLVHAWHSIPSTRFELYIRAHLKSEAQELLAEQVGRIKAKGGEAARAHLMEGAAVDEILDLAEELGVPTTPTGCQRFPAPRSSHVHRSSCPHPTTSETRRP